MRLILNVYLLLHIYIKLQDRITVSHIVTAYKRFYVSSWNRTKTQSKQMSLYKTININIASKRIIRCISETMIFKSATDRRITYIIIHTDNIREHIGIQRNMNAQIKRAYCSLVIKSCCIK